MKQPGFLRHPFIYILCLLVIAGHSSLVYPRDGLKTLQYPTSEPDGDEIARQTFYVNRFFSFSNISLDKHPTGVALIIQNSPGKKQTVTKLERHINNTYNDGVISSRELSVFRSGKLKGTSVLLTDYEDSNKNPTYTIWMPALRLMRTFEIGNTTDTWGGTVFSYSDMFSDGPDKEKHEIIGKRIFGECLRSIQIKNKRGKALKSITDAPVCEHQDKQIFVLKSQPLMPNDEYDYRIRYVDAVTFADYRLEFFKAGKLVKVIDKDWKPAGIKNNPRALQWHHIYGKDIISGLVTYIVVPNELITINQSPSSSFWSVETLKKLK